MFYYKQISKKLSGPRLITRKMENKNEGENLMTRLDDYGLRGLCGNPNITLKGEQNKIRHERFEKAFRDFKALYQTNDLSAFYRWLFEGTNPMESDLNNTSQNR